MGMFGNTSSEEPIYQTSYMGFWIRVYPNRVDFKSGVGSQSIPINQIASIQLAMAGVFQITLETTGGKKYSIPTSKKKEVQQAIYEAQARSAGKGEQQEYVAGKMSEQWGQPLSNPGGQQQWGQPPTPDQHQWGQQPPNPDWRQHTIPDQHQYGQPPLSPNLLQPPSNSGWQYQYGQQPSNPDWWQQSANLSSFQPSQIQPKKKNNMLWIVLGILVVTIALCGVVGNFAAKSSNTENTTTDQTTTSTNVTQVVQSAISPTAIPSPTPSPTPTPTPTKTAGQIEAQYKASTTSTTVTNLDKDGTADQGKDVHFTCTILNFVKDSTGATAGVNVTGIGTNYSSVVQIIFPDGTNITRLNEGDTLEIWGTDEGVFSGTNAFGGTVQEVGIGAKYLTDHTTNYQAGS